MGLFAGILATNKVRLHAMMWVVSISLSFWGVKGGLFTIRSGGVFHVIGPDNSIIGDNNQLALAIVMILPILNYLRVQTQSRFIKYGIIATIALNILTVLGTYSRGGVISLTTLAAAFWFRSKNKFIYPIIAVIVIIPVLMFMPDSFYARLSTINKYDEDTSVQGRLMAWEVAVRYATDHFPFGAGFYGPQLRQVFNYYFPNAENHAAHSIYFQVLGEHGYIALTLYILIIVLTMRNCSTILRKTAKVPELAWAAELSRMMQLSLLVFCVGGAALSMAYYDVFVLWVALSATLEPVIAREAQTLGNDGAITPEPVRRVVAVPHATASFQEQSGNRAARPLVNASSPSTQLSPAKDGLRGRGGVRGAIGPSRQI
jgi:probable O-glycosylation ligase (exosortase A-associated)